MKKIHLEEKYLTSLKRKIIKKETHPLTDNELERLASLLEKDSYTPDMNPIIWSIAWQSPKNTAMLKLSHDISTSNISANNDEIFNYYIEPAFIYYLQNSKVTEQKKIIKLFEKCNSLRLRMIVAEFNMQIGHIEKGLYLMVRILDEITTDHALSDSISMWIAQTGTMKIKNTFLQDAKKERKKGNISYAKTLEWVCENLFFKQ